jgi:GTPase SAR1 family protein
MANESSTSIKNSISNRYETIIIGDAYCGKTSYLIALAEHEKKMNTPINVSQDKSEFEFCVENKSKRIIFAVKDTASIVLFINLFILIF